MRRPFFPVASPALRRFTTHLPSVLCGMTPGALSPWDDSPGDWGLSFLGSQEVGHGTWDMGHGTWLGHGYPGASPFLLKRMLTHTHRERGKNSQIPAIWIGEIGNTAIPCSSPNTILSVNWAYWALLLQFWAHFLAQFWGAARLSQPFEAGRCNCYTLDTQYVVN